MGLFRDDHMEYHLKAQNQPSLEEMVEVAIKMLSRSSKGYFLFVEGNILKLLEAITIYIMESTVSVDCKCYTVWKFYNLWEFYSKFN